MPIAHHKVCSAGVNRNAFDCVCQLQLVAKIMTLLSFGKYINISELRQNLMQESLHKHHLNLCCIDIPSFPFLNA